MVRVCFVCLGNICRSPIGEGVLRHLADEAGLRDQIEIESAGTAGYHEGERPDPRARAAAARVGIHVDGRAQRFQAKDFARFDFVLAMDGDNLASLTRLAPDPAARSKLNLLRRFDPDAAPGAAVPDPYYGGEEDFDDVVQICLSACKPLLAALRTYDAR